MASLQALLSMNVQILCQNRTGADRRADRRQRQFAFKQVCLDMKQRIDPAREFDRLDAALASFATKVDNGEQVDTAVLARDVEALCEQLAASPPDGARSFAGNLHSLLAGLECLEQALRSKQEELQQRLTILAPPTETAERTGDD